MYRIFIAATLILVIGCSKKDGYIIEGVIEGTPESTPIYMQKVAKGSYVPMDTAEIIDGKFVFRGTFSQPEMVFLRIGQENKMINFFADNSSIKVESQLDHLGETQITGSDIHDQFMAFTEVLKPYGTEYTTLVEKYRQAELEKNGVKMESILEEIENVDDNQDKAIFDFLKPDINSFLQLFIIENYLSYKIDGAKLQELLNQIDPSARMTDEYGRLSNRLEVLQKVAIGQPALHFALNDTTGTPLPLSGFEGKYLLIDFWASWCAPCRQENPKVVELYKEFKDQGFEILGVSFDNNRAQWLKAIEQDGLTWKHVSDLKGWQSAAGQLYGIKSIPHTVLIDPEGIIIAKNLKTEELRKKLKALFDQRNA